MMPSISRTLPTVFLMLASTQAVAQDIEPGLWEMQIEMQSSMLGGAGGAAPAEMAAMLQRLENAPPEARAMLERLGISGMGVGGDGGMKMKVKTCVTPEDIKGGLFEDGKQEGDCTYSNVSQKGNTWQGNITCKGGTNGTGNFVGTLHSRDHYSLEGTMNSAEAGKARMKVDSKRLGADCGTVGQGGLFGAMRNFGN